MADAMMIPYEHVTKMGRVGKALTGQQDKKKAMPRFRKLPFQDDYVATSSSPDPDRVHKAQKPKRRGRNRSGNNKKSLEVKVKEPFSPRAEPPTRLKEPQAVTFERQFKHREPYTPYVEMKLGRNMRAAPKGSIAARPPPNINPQQLETDVSEPLLHNQSLPSNAVVDYYTHTHPTQPPLTEGSQRLFPARSMATPQHPSQDLIEMLNRNNHTSERQDSLAERQREAAAHQERLEAELRRMREEKHRKGGQVELETERDREETAVKPLFEMTPEPTEGIHTISAPPPPNVSALYSSYRKKEDFEDDRKPAEKVSTQPLSPQSSTLFSQGAAMSGGFREQTSDRERKQETVDEVEDIPEDIDSNASDDDKIKDDDFDF